MEALRRNLGAEINALRRPTFSAEHMRALSFASLGVRVRLHEDPSSGVAGSVWESAAPVLNHILRLEHECNGYFKGKRVVDLGSGTGIVGLLLAHLGAHVVLTDLQSQLPLLRWNAQQNFADPALRPAVAELTWGESTDEFTGEHGSGWDIVVASDCIYNTRHAPALLSTIGVIAAGGGPALWFSFAERNTEREAEIVLELGEMFDTSREETGAPQCDDIQALFTSKEVPTRFFVFTKAAPQ
eukprot:TRINITY_DN12792_c0_g1_i1.p1 TRINITY_DN12792_c0_g1~~TRINITY_DN12792_c0_g1_i1.p1  ORF type:complete len:242 (+),score=83.26 TRINITY_DN12792_c0_g1_i1:111-836(+)